jgi:hypothetical protein
LTSSLLLDFIYNFQHELKLDLWEFKKLYKEKLRARKEKKRKWHVLRHMKICK